eukprot:5269463-Alexandrium_andersonii.AAC.1
MTPRAPVDDLAQHPALRPVVCSALGVGAGPPFLARGASVVPLVLPAGVAHGPTVPRIAEVVEVHLDGEFWIWKSGFWKTADAHCQWEISCNAGRPHRRRRCRPRDCCADGGPLAGCCGLGLP